MKRAQKSYKITITKPKLLLYDHTLLIDDTHKVRSNGTTNWHKRSRMLLWGERGRMR